MDCTLTRGWLAYPLAFFGILFGISPDIPSGIRGLIYCSVFLGKCYVSFFDCVFPLVSAFLFLCFCVFPVFFVFCCFAALFLLFFYFFVFQFFFCFCVVLWFPFVCLIDSFLFFVAWLEAKMPMNKNTNNVLLSKTVSIEKNNKSKR